MTLSPTSSRPSGGGSQPLTVVRTTLAYNTPNLVLTGIPIYTPSVGDLVSFLSFISVTTAWNGATPTLNLYATGDNMDTENIWHLDLTHPNFAVSSRATAVSNYGPQPTLLPTTAPLKLAVDDGAGGDPGSSQGAGVLTLVIQSGT